MAANAVVIWLCACVRYWSYSGVGTCASVPNLVDSLGGTQRADISNMSELSQKVSPMLKKPVCLIWSCSDVLGEVCSSRKC